MQQPKFILTFLVWTFVFSLALDFRAQESGGGLLQYIMTGLALISSFLIIFSGSIPRKQKIDRKSLHSLIALGLFFLIVVISQLINRNTMFYFWRVLLPYVLLAAGFSVSLKLIYAGFSIKSLINLLALACICSAIFRFAYAILYLNIEIDSARWEILSPGLPFLFAFGLVYLMFARHLNILAIIALTVSSSSALLSVTRSYIIVLLLAAGGTGLCLKAQAEASNKNFLNHLISVSKKFIWLGLAGFIVILFVLWLRPNAFDEWNQRIHQREHGTTSSDLTWMTRVAEMKGMLEEMNNPEAWLMGKGFGAGFFYSSDYMAELVEHTSDAPFEEENQVAGHNFWIYQIFGVGLIGAIVLFYFLALNFLISYRQVKASASLLFQQPEIAVPFVAICSMLGETFTATPLGERFGGLLLGICLGLGSTSKSPSWTGIRAPKNRMLYRGSIVKNK